MRLRCAGFAAVLRLRLSVALVGLALVPMAGGPRAVAQRPAEKPVDQAPGKSSAAVNEPETRPAPDPPLRGRIVDEEGKPVTDATIQLVNLSTRVVQKTATNRNGGFHFDRIWTPGAGEIENLQRSLSRHHFDCPK